jgi:hypothetical protein
MAHKKDESHTSRMPTSILYYIQRKVDVSHQRLSDQETPELTWGGVVSRAWKSGIVWKTGLFRRGSSW